MNSNPRRTSSGKIPQVQAAAQRTVLIVDDEPDILSSLGEFFHEFLPTVRLMLAGSGADAIKAMRRHTPDLVISDYRMHGMDGLEFLRLAQEIAPFAPRIMMTAYPDAHLAVEARVAVNVSLLVTKPFDVIAFGRMVGSLLGLPMDNGRGPAQA